MTFCHHAEVYVVTDFPSLPILPQLCCESSLEAGESLYATASRVDTWLLLEYNLPWEAKALPASKLPDEVKSFLSGLLQSIPNSRFQFIRQRAPDSSGIRFYLCQSAPMKPALYRLNLSAYRDLLSLDVQSILAGWSGIKPVDERLFLVCTNGRRDPCCAWFGVPLYEAMKAYADDEVWQTIHLGGHRFAGTMVCLPHGLYYGRVGREEVPTIVDATRAGHVHLDNYRGCCTYEALVQAAEYFLRRETGILALDGLQFVNVETLNEHSWIVRFTASGQSCEVYITSRLSDFEIYESTGSAEKSRQTIYEPGGSHEAGGHFTETG
jgi:hypothetical protein